MRRQKRTPFTEDRDSRIARAVASVIEKGISVGDAARKISGASGMYRVDDYETIVACLRELGHDVVEDAEARQRRERREMDEAAAASEIEIDAKLTDNWGITYRCFVRWRPEDKLGATLKLTDEDGIGPSWYLSTLADGIDSILIDAGTGHAIESGLAEAVRKAMAVAGTR